jgi:hypothetical protein
LNYTNIVKPYLGPGRTYPPIFSKNSPALPINSFTSSPTHCPKTAILLASNSLTNLPATRTPSPLLFSSVATSTITFATASGLLTSSPAATHLSEIPLVRCVLVKKGAMALMRILCFAASDCEERRRPTTPCFEDV